MLARCSTSSHRHAAWIGGGRAASTRCTHYCKKRRVLLRVGKHTPRHSSIHTLLRCALRPRGQGLPDLTFEPDSAPPNAQMKKFINCAPPTPQPSEIHTISIDSCSPLTSSALFRVASSFFFLILFLFFSPSPSLFVFLNASVSVFHML